MADEAVVVPKKASVAFEDESMARLRFLRPKIWEVDGTSPTPSGDSWCD